MMAVAIFLLCWGAAGLLTAAVPASTPARPPPAAPPPAGRAGRTRRPSRQDPTELAGMVRQLAALLAAGRAGSALWQALAAVLESEDQAGSSRGPGHPAVARVLVIERATQLGLPTGAAIRAACEPRAESRTGRWASHRPGRHDDAVLWQELAACFEVGERSGAPLAEVLDRLAERLEAEADARALREAALAGPRATVRLLGWLPLLGLGLGVALGADPLRTLTGSGLGWSVLLLGGGLLWAGRSWAAVLIRAAAAPEARPRRGAARRSRSRDGP